MKRGTIVTLGTMRRVNEYYILTVVLLLCLSTGLSKKKKKNTFKEVKMRNGDFDVIPIDRIPADTEVLDIIGNNLSEVLYD